MECVIRFLPSRRAVRVPGGTSLLEAARRAGLPVARACGGEASCARCGLLIVEGSDGLAPESEHERDAKRSNRVDAELRLSCLLRVAGDLTVSAPYW